MSVFDVGKWPQFMETVIMCHLSYFGMVIAHLRFATVCWLGSGQMVNLRSVR